MQIFKLQAYHPGVCDLDLLKDLQHKFINVNTLRPSRIKAERQLWHNEISQHVICSIKHRTAESWEENNSVVCRFVDFVGKKSEKNYGLERQRSKLEANYHLLAIYLLTWAAVTSQASEKLVGLQNVNIICSWLQCIMVKCNLYVMGKHRRHLIKCHHVLPWWKLVINTACWNADDGCSIIDNFMISY